MSSAPAKKVPAKKAPASKEKAVKEPKAPKAPKEKVEREVQNDVTRPKDGSQTGQVWAIADALTKETKASATRADVMERATAAGINEATIATQYQRWRVFNGVPKAAKAPKAPKAPKAEKAAPAKKAAGKKVPAKKS